MHRHLLFAGGLSWLVRCFVLFSASFAGGGPENLFLLVNANSASSCTIANHYVALRDIPPSHVLYLDWQGDNERIKVAKFRTAILQPAFAAMRQRGLMEQIDYLVYSSDFPWLIDLRADYKDKELPKQLSPLGSTTGMTYLCKFVLAGSFNMVGLRNNLYVQPPDAAGKTHSHGFRSWYGWGKDGRLMEAGGQTYMLSTMLGVTSGRGNSLDEVQAYLQRSASADATSPPGTIYYMKNGDVRSQTRHDRFPDAVEALQELGVAAEILEGRLPPDKPDVMGTMVGTASFDWQQCGSTILPGAICEHLTSLGGILREGAGQTPLTEFLRHGAAGSSGTVTEPFAIQEKFPLASIHVHYARGCSLAESFYQSVAGPYQLLIVGDPLCRPWAKIPQITFSGIEPDQEVSGMLTIDPAATTSGDSTVDRFELMIDGRRVGRSRKGEPLSLDTLRVPDGHHELAVVGIENSNIESQGRREIPIRVNNHQLSVRLESTPTGVVAGDGKLTLRASMAGAENVAIVQNRRLLGVVEGASGEIEVEAAELGSGPVVLQAVGQAGNRQAVSAPLRITVK